MRKWLSYTLIATLAIGLGMMVLAPMRKVTFPLEYETAFLYGATDEDVTARVTSALASYQEVVIMPGTFKISSTVTIPGGKVLRGFHKDPNKTILKDFVVTGAMFNMIEADQYTRSKIMNMKLAFQNDADSSVDIGITLNAPVGGGWETEITNIIFDFPETTYDVGGTGIIIDGTDAATTWIQNPCITDCTFRAGDYGIVVKGAVHMSLIDTCYFVHQGLLGAGSCIKIGDSTYTNYQPSEATIRRCGFWAVPPYCLDLQADVHLTTIQNCHFELEKVGGGTSGGALIRLDNDTSTPTPIKTLIEGNRFVYNASHNATDQFYCILGNRSISTTIRDNTFKLNNHATSYGLRMYDDCGPTIMTNSFSTPFADSVNGIAMDLRNLSLTNSEKPVILNNYMSGWTSTGRMIIGGIRRILQWTAPYTTKFEINTGTLISPTAPDNTYFEQRTTGTAPIVGTGTLVAGTLTVSTTAVTAASQIFVTPTSAPLGTLYVSAKVAGTSFTVTSTNAGDVASFNWKVIN